jgi:tyrosine-protein phosphatase SIW14
MNSSQFARLRQFAALLLLGSTLATAAFGAPSFPSAASRMEGVGNFQKVDEHVYRGAQPTRQGFSNLGKLGIQTVIDLREPGDRSATERKWVTDAGMRYVSVPMSGMATPANDSVLKVLALLEDRGDGPVFVHCKRGADRTGGVIACYRVEHDHWKNDQALTEARSMGMSWFQTAIQSYVRKYRPRDLTASAALLAPMQP